jgi:hypothetical protein
MKRFIVIGAILVILVAGMAISSMTRAFADDPHTAGQSGQPSQSCQAVFGPGSPLVPNGFNTNGFATAEAHYAGSQPQNSNNPNSVSQYDVACFQAGQH